MFLKERIRCYFSTNFNINTINFTTFNENTKYQKNVIEIYLAQLKNSWSQRLCVCVCSRENWIHHDWWRCVWAVKEKQSEGSTHWFIDWFLDRQAKKCSTKDCQWEKKAVYFIVYLKL